MAEDSPVRLAIAGCGKIAELNHIPAALKSQKVTLQALIDSVSERAEVLMRRFGFQATVAQKLDDVLGSIDGLLIATPNHAHFSLASQALNAGIPVLVEKPLTGTSDEAFRLCELAEKRGSFISVGYRTRHHANVQLMKELLDKGYFGRIRSFLFEFGSAGGWAPMSGYSLDRKMAGGGVLVGTGTHFLDRMLYWFGDPEIVAYEDDSYGGVEANCRARVRYRDIGGIEGEFEGTIILSKTAALRNRFTMDTERYSCVMPESEVESFTVYPHENPGLEMQLYRRQVGPRGPSDSFQVQIEEFADCIRTGRQPLVDGRTGARSVKLFEDFYERRTELPEPWAWYRNTAREGN